MSNLGLGSSVLLILLFSTHFAYSLPSSQSKLLKRSDEVKDSYDYVIVGGGTAGLTVADRLTEDGKYTVLVIEHGTYDNGSLITNVTFGYQGLLNNSHLHLFPSVPQVNLRNRTTNIITGDLLGGSSGVNGLVVHRGTEEDYDRWAGFFGGKSSWGWNGLLPYFKKAFTFTPPDAKLAQRLDIKTDSSYWGRGTRIFASFPTFNWRMLKIQVNAFKDIPGATFPPDSGSGQPGVFWYPTTEDPVTVTRSFARTGHWDGISRWNYETITGSRVINILLHDSVATGVAFVPSSATSATSDNTRVVKARKEVILSAGTIFSPQILQSSGIGPRNMLEAANITVKVELPGVGSNFQDHPLGGNPTFFYNNFPIDPSPEDLQSNSTFVQLADQEFAEHRTGPLSIASGNAGAFLPLPVIAPATYQSIATRYESQSPSAYLPSGTHPTVIAGYQAQKKALAAAMRSHGTGFYNHFLMGSQSQASSLVLLHPISRGTIHINASDPIFSTPIVDYRTLSNPIELDILVEFVKFQRRYYTVPSLAPFQPVESNASINAQNDEQIREFIKDGLGPSTFHPVGTNPMMPLELGGVVDQELRVYGVRNLRVVDASVIPTIPGAYTQQTTYAIGEKGADLIKASQ